eukprot:3723036-Rhodomonas_salina.1
MAPRPHSSDPGVSHGVCNVEHVRGRDVRVEVSFLDRDRLDSYEHKRLVLDHRVRHRKRRVQQERALVPPPAALVPVECVLCA